MHPLSFLVSQSARGRQPAVREDHPGGLAENPSSGWDSPSGHLSAPRPSLQKERISVFPLNHSSFHPGPHPGGGTDVGLGQNFLLQGATHLWARNQISGSQQRLLCKTWDQIEK